MEAQDLQHAVSADLRKIYKSEYAHVELTNFLTLLHHTIKGAKGVDGETTGCDPVIIIC